MTSLGATTHEGFAVAITLPSPFDFAIKKLSSHEYRVENMKVTLKELQDGAYKVGRLRVLKFLSCTFAVDALKDAGKNFEELRRIVFDNCTVNSIVLAQIEKIPNLEEISFKYCMFTRDVTEKTFKQLSSSEEREYSFTECGFE